MIIKPRIRNSVCLSAHPRGCASEVRRQIDYAKGKGLLPSGPKKVLVIGASTGYGLASRITAAFASGAATIGVAFEKPGSERQCGTSGYYNMQAFDSEAKAAGLFSQSFNGDAFSREMKDEVAAAVKEHLGQVDMIVYSLASPVRKDPESGETYRSTLKPIGEAYTSRSVDFLSGEVRETTIHPASDEEIAQTVKVMGGEDWELWMEALEKKALLAPGVKTVAYSYVGPEVTKPIYRRGTIGRAKEHLEASAHGLTEGLLAPLGGKAYVSVNKALVTRAAAVIPVVALYIAMLYKVMKAKGIHEGCIEQMGRLFRERLYTGDEPPPLDAQGRIRIDDWEMRPDVQEEISTLWDKVNTETIEKYSDLEGYRTEFLRLNGFALEGIDYDAEVDPRYTQVV